MELTGHDLARIRFAVSPWWETVVAARAVTRGGALHRAWAADVVRALRADEETARHWPQLSAFVHAAGWIADALTPTPTRDETFAETRTRVQQLDPQLWQADIDTARQKAESDEHRRVLGAFEADVPAGVRRLTDAVTWFHALAVAPHWDRIQAVAADDISHRSRLLGRDGLEEMLSTLHPQVRRVPTGLEIAGKTCDLSRGMPGSGLTLIPSVFAWPGTLVLATPAFVRTLTYSPRGIGRLWEHGFATPDEISPLGALIGATRSCLLVHLDLPMTTTQLSTSLRFAPATLSAHLKVLEGAGLASSFRRGREVFYERTDLGEELVATAVPRSSTVVRVA